jgi:hypothetical protein
VGSREVPVHPSGRALALRLWQIAHFQSRPKPRGGEGLACRPRRRSAVLRLFPPGLHAARRHRSNRLPEQGSGLRPAVPRGRRDAALNRGRSQAPRCSHRRHCGAPHLRIGDDPSPARPHDRAGWRDIAPTGHIGRAATPAFCCQCACFPACFGGSSWRRSPTPTRQAALRS